MEVTLSTPGSFDVPETKETECAHCGNPMHGNYKAVHFQNMNMTFCDGDCEERYSYIEKLNTATVTLANKVMEEME
jgi:hypothetical protein